MGKYTVDGNALGAPGRLTTAQRNLAEFTNRATTDKPGEFSVNQQLYQLGYSRSEILETQPGSESFKQTFNGTSGFLINAVRANLLRLQTKLDKEAHLKEISEAEINRAKQEINEYTEKLNELKNDQASNEKTKKMLYFLYTDCLTANIQLLQKYANTIDSHLKNNPKSATDLVLDKKINAILSSETIVRKANIAVGQSLDALRNNQTVIQRPPKAPTTLQEFYAIKDNLPSYYQSREKETGKFGLFFREFGTRTTKRQKQMEFIKDIINEMEKTTDKNMNDDKKLQIIYGAMLVVDHRISKETRLFDLASRLQTFIQDTVGLKSTMKLDVNKKRAVEALAEHMGQKKLNPQEQTFLKKVTATKNFYKSKMSKP